MKGIDGAICDRFVICNADSTTHVDAISGEIEDKLIEINGEKPLRATHTCTYTLIIMMMRMRM